VHTFGFGDGVDRYLVKELAKNGKGKSYFLSSGANINEDVITALKEATKPALTGLEAKWSCETEIQNPRAPCVENYFTGETFILTAILRPVDLKDIGTLNLKVFNTLENIEQNLSLILDFSKAEEGSAIFKLAA
jgi:hypothetical protein